MGAKDIGHKYYGPETGDRVQESNPGPSKRLLCKGSDSNPGPTKRPCCKVRGSNPGPTKKTGYFIFLVRIGQFPENGQRQMAYIKYLIEVRGNTYKKVYVF